MINKVILVGRITKDPELKKTNSGTYVVKFTLAVNKIVSSSSEKKLILSIVLFLVNKLKI